MSGVASIGKEFKRALKPKNLLRTAAVVAVVWFTAGTAMNMFPAVGEGMAFGEAAMAQGSSMWTATTEFFGADAVATGNLPAQQTSTAMLTNGGVEVVGSGVTEVGITNAQIIAPDVAAMTETGLTNAGNYGLADGSLALNSQGIAAAADPLAGGALDIAGSTATKQAGTGMFSWMKDNPMATMVLGQGVSGAASSYEAGKTADADRAAADEAWRRKGTMGYDYQGNYAGQPDPMVNRQQAQTVQTQATAQPIVAGQQVQPQSMPPAQRKVKRSDLPGLIQGQQQA